SSYRTDRTNGTSATAGTRDPQPDVVECARRNPHVSEAQWCVCHYPDNLLDMASQRTSSRKLRLFGVACCRRIDALLTEPLSRQGVDVAERFAEGLADERELAEMEFALEMLCQTIPDSDTRAPCTAVYRCTHRFAYHAALWSAYWTAKLSTP